MGHLFNRIGEATFGCLSGSIHFVLLETLCINRLSVGGKKGRIPVLFFGGVLLDFCVVTRARVDGVAAAAGTISLFSQ
jgi:hypothetical protein